MMWLLFNPPEWSVLPDKPARFYLLPVWHAQRQRIYNRKRGIINDRNR